MLASLPPIVDAYKLAKQNKTLQGDLVLDKMPRIARLLYSNQGRVTVKLSFTREYGISILTGKVSAEIELICQRCLEAMPFSVVLDIKFGFRNKHERKAENRNKFTDDMDILIIDDGNIQLSDIIEDELILALPLVATHEFDSCSASQFIRKKRLVDNGDKTAKKLDATSKPFADLKNKMKR